MRLFAAVLFVFFAIGLYGQEAENYAPVFSVPGGIHGGAVTVSLSSPNADARIFYTTDGSKPRSGSRSYRDPINIKKITVIRAIAYVNGKPSDIVTNTYLIGRNYTMPIVSISTDSSNFWSIDRGIYVKGTGGLPNYPYRGANYWKSWEREVNIEYYEPDGTVGFNQRADVKIFGGWSRPLPQKSLAIYARKEYGEKYFRHKIFRDKDLKKFKSLVLRNSGSDFNKTQFRDAFMTSLLRDEDLEIQAYQPCAVYINGNYWGVQNMREKINEQYVRFNAGADPDSVDMMKHRDDLKAGKRKHYKNMLKFMRLNDMSKQANFDSLTKLMDVDNYATYNITETYLDNHDAGGNIRYWRPNTPGGIWRWILFDTDFGFSIGNWKAYKVNTLEMFTDPSGPKWPNPPWSTFIIRKLLDNPDYKRKYINRFADMLNTTFHPDTVNSHLDYFQEMYKGEMPHHFKRWGGNMERWERSIKVMHDFGTNRPHYVRTHIMQKWGFKDTATITVDADSKMGYVTFNSLELKQFPYSGIYFAGNEVTITAHPYFEYEFIGWEGSDSKELTITVDPTEDKTIKAIFRAKPQSGMWQAIRFSEVGFNVKKGRGYDWVELHNGGTQAVDLSGWMFMDKKDKNRFVIPAGTEMQPGEYLVLCENLDTFQLYYSDTLKAIGGWDFGLSSKGEKIRLYDESTLVVDSLTYYPKEVGKADKDKGTMSLNDPSFDNTNTANWSAHKNGSPGAINKEHAEELQRIADEERMNMYLMIGGGGGLLLVVLLFFLKWRQKRKRGSAAVGSD